MIFANPLRRAHFRPPPPSSPRWFHRRLPGYSATPLHEVPALADRFGIGRLFVKDESERLGLPSFKMLGASWASYRALEQRHGGLGNWRSIEELREAVAPLRPLTLATATDGNHGRAVARIARLLGLSARIWIPANTVEARIAAIAGEGAEVHISCGGYDDAVTEAAAAADSRTLVISDTSWPGYEQVPRWVIEGYGTIMEEIDEQLAEVGLGPPDTMLVPIGVGALAAAVAAHSRAAGATTKLIGVEPADAACVLESARAGGLITLPGEQNSIMAGLNCATPSPVAWPTVSAGYDWFVTVTDASVIAAMRMLNGANILSGESGAAPLAALAAMAEQDKVLAPGSSVVLLSTEGVTDPEFYAREIQNRT